MTSSGQNFIVPENIHPSDIVHISKLFFPELVFVDDCVFFKEKYNEFNYNQWKIGLKSDSKQIERMMNHIHVYDLYENHKEDIEDTVFLETAKLLKFSWELYFYKTFPDKALIIELSVGENDYGPTLYLFQEID